MNDQLYRRSMGLRYDPDLLEREIANGYSTGHSSSERPQDIPAFDMAESDLLVVEVTGDENTQRLQEIEFELAQQITPAERIELEAEKVVRLEQRRLDALAEKHPRYAEALHEWLETEMTHLVESHVPIDDEMLAEAEILDQIIAEVSEDSEDRPLIKIAEVMKGVIEAQHLYQEISAHTEHVLAA